MEPRGAGTASQIEFATFFVGDVLMGVDIRQVREINRELLISEVPQAPNCVRGVVNLRGDVVTVLDLRVVLGMEPIEIGPRHRCVVVDDASERIGLLVDRISDVVTAHPEAFEPPPANVGGVDGRFLRSVYKLDSELLVVLDVMECLATDEEQS
ncbi:MAG: chemotaxis protein CheW [Phycisphaerae bacterium]